MLTKIIFLSVYYNFIVLHKWKRYIFTSTLGRGYRVRMRNTEPKYNQLQFNIKY